MLKKSFNGSLFFEHVWFKKKPVLKKNAYRNK